MAAQQKKNVWAFRFTTLSLVLIPVAVGINYVGKLFAAALKLPLWLDSIGTVLAGMLAGPWIGAISGGVNNIIFGITADPVSFWYLITSIVIGLLVGYLAMTGWIRNSPGPWCWASSSPWRRRWSPRPSTSSCGRAPPATSGATPCTRVLRNGGTPVWIASFIDELVVDLLDKVATVIISFLIFKALPQRLVGLFAGEGQVEKL